MINSDLSFNFNQSEVMKLEAIAVIDWKVNNCNWLLTCNSVDLNLNINV